jgi:uncharacterized membrane protein
MPTELIVLKYSTPTGADEMLEVLKDFQAKDFIELLDAVIVTKSADQKVHVRQPLEIGPGRGAAFGALTGAVVGLLGGPGGAIVGFVAGAATGGVTAAAMEADLPEKDIKALASDELQPGESALMVYFEEIWIDQIEQAIRDFGKTVKRQVIRAERQAEHEAAAEVRKEKIDAAVKSWQATIDQQRAHLASLREQSHTAVQADRDAIRRQIDAANTRLHEFYENVLHTLQVWGQQLDARISQLEADAKKATGQTKADIDQRLVAAQQERQVLRSNVRATLTTRLNNLKADIQNLKTQAAKARSEAIDPLNQRIAKLQGDWDAEVKRLDQLDQAEGEAWETMVKSIDQAIADYEDAVRKAEAEHAKAGK